MSLPEVTHTYQNHVLDNTRWQHYQPRPDDIIISTSYKSGTTWMQEMVRQLVFLGQDVPERSKVALWDVSPWLEARFEPIESLLPKLEAQTHRRFIKTHLALDGLLFFPELKYIVVGRDARDVAMSMWNHYDEFTPETYEGMNNIPGRVGEPLSPPTDIHDYLQQWLTKGWFDWECEGYPFWGNMHHTRMWWNYRHLPNILFVHYHDLKKDLPSELRRVAAFLGTPLPEAAIPDILKELTLEAMRERERGSSHMQAWKNGANSFFFKGTNGRWKDVFTDEELALYHGTASKVLAPECRAWLEQGRIVL